MLPLDITPSRRSLPLMSNSQLYPELNVQQSAIDELTDEDSDGDVPPEVCKLNVEL